jgi:hypothetical protein
VATLHQDFRLVFQPELREEQREAVG